MVGSAYRESQVTFGMHRYAVAIENYIDKKILPEANVSKILQSPTKWWTAQDDIDTFMTLFRDYPHYYSETQGLSASEINNRVLSLFGRGTINDVAGQVQVFFAGDGTKGDIEPGTGITGFRSTATGDKNGLADTDTLTAPFLDLIAQFIGNHMKMIALQVENMRPFYGLIIEEQDKINLFANSNSTLTQSLKDISGIHTVGEDIVKQHPIFTRSLGGLYNINFISYASIAREIDERTLSPNNVVQFKNTIYDGLAGKAIKPEAKILAAATTGDTVTGLTVYGAGYLTSGLTRGVSAVANTYQLFVSGGARMFPYFDGTSIGGDSINSIDKGWYNDGVTPGSFNSTYVGRMQIGQGKTATTRWKVVYKGPIYSGTIQVGSNLGLNTFIEDAYKLEIIGLHRWNNSTGKFEAANTLAADWATFKAFLGINATTKVIDPALQTLQYVFNRRIHMFDTVRSLIFGSNLLYKVNGGGVEYATETRDYGSFTGQGLSVVQGKKLVQDGHGIINNHAIVAFKRPPVYL